MQSRGRAARLGVDDIHQRDARPRSRPRCPEILGLDPVRQAAAAPRMASSAKEAVYDVVAEGGGAPRRRPANRSVDALNAHWSSRALRTATHCFSTLLQTIVTLALLVQRADHRDDTSEQLLLFSRVLVNDVAGHASTIRAAYVRRFNQRRLVSCASVQLLLLLLLPTRCFEALELMLAHAQELSDRCAGVATESKEDVNVLRRLPHRGAIWLDTVLQRRRVAVRRSTLHAQRGSHFPLRPARLRHLRAIATEGEGSAARERARSCTNVTVEDEAVVLVAAERRKQSNSTKEHSEEKVEKSYESSFHTHTNRT